ncbi:prostate and testis expressed protein 13-like isoform X1 [Rattus norvegicus]|uniref:UPAR/Ly6 domain-containing protein n=1 Tax=Rattus norvegicus TaxID=10116 RepID=A0ABK0LNB8_RAT|nr:prostate and testis expressed protein 2-like isoform X1 [Rattus norvegicus]|eukprot:XP_008764297.1 PREDICTED: prostate and testis expressed protein 2-like [Rattus norvegicus]
MSQKLLLSVSIILLMDIGERVVTIRFIKICNLCSHHDGFECRTGMRSCWKFDILPENRTCTTENYYYTDRYTGLNLFRYAKLSCRPCAPGMYQMFHDLMRETFCCTDKNYCNDGTANSDISSLLIQDKREQKELNDD